MALAMSDSGARPLRRRGNQKRERRAWGQKEKEILCHYNSNNRHNNRLPHALSPYTHAELVTIMNCITCYPLV
jgi:hypothetical protein